LGSLVLPRFVKGEGREVQIDWETLRNTINVSVRFLDNVLAVNNYPLPEIQATCSQIRQIGLGVMGLHDTLLMMGLRYNSDSGLEFVDKLMAFIKNAAYNASVDLAIEKGAFPKFQAEPYLKGGFAKTLKPSLRTRIRENGLRNCTLLTIAPTGTTSMVCEVSSGIEPMFAPAYLRRYRDGDNLREETVIHPLFKQFVENKRGVKHFQGSHDLSLRDHLEMQRVCQKHIDNACSKTINVMRNIKEEELSDIIMEYLPELKGLTIYPEGSRENQPLTPLSLDDAIKYLKEGKETKTEATSKDSCKNGSCDI
jgi:ribonucleoside-diphosphate reductase alpha chain